MKVDNSRHWYVLFTNARAEKKVAERLHALRVETFLPLEKTLRIWSDRKKKVEIPLIPSVVFVCTTSKELTDLYQVPGVYSVLSEQGQPGIVREEEIENLRVLVGGELIERDVQSEWFVAGDKIEVITGPLKGLYGTAIENISHFRVLVEVPQLGMGFAINVPKNCVRKV